MKYKPKAKALDSTSTGVQSFSFGLDLEAFLNFQTLIIDNW